MANVNTADLSKEQLIEQLEALRGERSSSQPALSVVPPARDNTPPSMRALDRQQVISLTMAEQLPLLTAAVERNEEARLADAKRHESCLDEIRDEIRKGNTFDERTAIAAEQRTEMLRGVLKVAKWILSSCIPGIPAGAWALWG